MMGTSPNTLQPSSALAASLDWITGLLLGSLAVGLCVIAIAFVGMMMLSGRVALREGAQVVLGCFVLIGAPVIASGLIGAWQVDQTSYEPPANIVEYAERRVEPSPAEFDPYAGASLRRE